MDSNQYSIPPAGVYCPCCSQPQSYNNDCQIDLATSGDWQEYYNYPAEGLEGVFPVTEPQAHYGCLPSQ